MADVAQSILSITSKQEMHDICFVCMFSLAWKYCFKLFIIIGKWCHRTATFNLYHCVQHGTIHGMQQSMWKAQVNVKRPTQGLAHKRPSTKCSCYYQCCCCYLKQKMEGYWTNIESSKPHKCVKTSRRFSRSYIECSQYSREDMHRTSSMKGVTVNIFL